jgi:hypothetical protein
MLVAKRVCKAAQIVVFSAMGVFSAIGAYLVLLCAAQRIDSGVGRILELFWIHIFTAKHVNWESDLSGFFLLTTVFAISEILACIFVVGAVRSR